MTENEIDAVFVTSSDLSGTSGHNVATKEMAVAFARHDDVGLRLLCPEPGREHPPKLRSAVDEIHHLPPAGDRSPRQRIEMQFGLFRQLVRLFRNDPPDLLVVRHAATMIAPVPVAKLFGVPTCLLVRGLSHQNLKFPRLLERIFQFNVRYAESVCVAFEDVKRTVDEYRRAGTSEAFLFPNAVDPEAFAPISKDTARERLEIDGEPDLTVGFVGSLKARHRISELIEATALLDDDLSVQLVVVGDGPERTAIESLVESHGLEDVVCPGFVDHEDVPVYVAACDVLYGVVDPDSPSNPIKCYEYLACGRPIVTSATEEFAFVERVGAGRTVDEIRPEAIADCLESFAELEHDDRIVMGARGREYVLEHHTWQQLPPLVIERTLEST